MVSMALRQCREYAPVAVAERIGQLTSKGKARVFGGPTENRTRVHGFAVRCVTTPPSGLAKWDAANVRLSLQSQASGDAGDPKILGSRRGKLLGVACMLI